MIDSASSFEMLMLYISPGLFFVSIILFRAAWRSLSSSLNLLLAELRAWFSISPSRSYLKSIFNKFLGVAWICASSSELWRLILMSFADISLISDTFRVLLNNSFYVVIFWVLYYFSMLNSSFSWSETAIIMEDKSIDFISSSFFVFLFSNFILNNIGSFLTLLIWWAWLL